MAGKYFYKGVDIANLIQPNGTLNAPGNDTNINYVGFYKVVRPGSINGTKLTTNFASVGSPTTDPNSSVVNGGFITRYKWDTNIDFGTPKDSNINEICARYIDYYYTNGSQLTIDPPFSPCNHISVACQGGGGGRGGGGGIGQGASVYRGGSGGIGGSGGYAAAEKIPLNGQTIYLTVGKGGSGGGGGAKAKPNEYNSGGGGSPGGKGDPTTLNIGNINILTGGGGNGGSGGGGGNTANAGGNGASGNFVDGNVNPNFGGNRSFVLSQLTALRNAWNNTNSETPVDDMSDTLNRTNPVTVHMTGNGSGGQTGGEPGISHTNGANAGQAGEAGWARIYFLLI
jgi:hypothetical protein